MELDDLNTLVKEYQNVNHLNKILPLAMCSFLKFCDENWNTKTNFNLEDYLNIQWPKDIDINMKLQRDSEPIHTNILYPELLYFAHQLFSALYATDESLVSIYIFI